MRYAALILTAVVAFTSGCQGGRARERVVFAVMANALVTSGAPAESDAAALLKKAVDEVNAARDVQFTVLMGNTLGDGQARSLDRLMSVLGEMKKPYYVVLGPEGLGADEPAAAPPAAEGATPAVESASPAAPEAATPAAPAPATGGTPTLSRALLVWSFRGHGFEGPQPYWVADAGGGLVLVGLYTAGPGAGRPGHVDARQLQWLDETLKARAGHAVVVFGYHALVSLHPFDNTVGWADRLVDNRQEVLDILGRHRNVTAVVSASHGFAAGRVVGDIVYLTEPALAAWPLAYDLVSVGPNRIERQYLPIGTDDQTRQAFDRLAESPATRQLFGAGERAEQQIIQVFGGRKTESWNLGTLRP